MNDCACNSEIYTDRTFKSETNGSMHLRILLYNNDTSAEQMKNIEQCNNLSYNFYDLGTIIWCSLLLTEPSLHPISLITISILPPITPTSLLSKFTGKNCAHVTPPPCLWNALSMPSFNLRCSLQFSSVPPVNAMAVPSTKPWLYLSKS